MGKEFKTNVSVPCDTWNHWQQLIAINDFSDCEDIEARGAKEDDEILLASVVFEDGAKMSLTMLSGQHNYYIDSLLVLPNGHTVYDDSEPAFDLDTEMKLECFENDTSYTIQFELVEEEVLG